VSSSECRVSFAEFWLALTLSLSPWLLGPAGFDSWDLCPTRSELALSRARSAASMG
jgi:hypothetical protein